MYLRHTYLFFTEYAKLPVTEHYSYRAKRAIIFSAQNDITRMQELFCNSRTDGCMKHIFPKLLEAAIYNTRIRNILNENRSKFKNAEDYTYAKTGSNVWYFINKTIFKGAIITGMLKELFPVQFIHFNATYQRLVELLI